jgi:hypothetical protein
MTRRKLIKRRDEVRAIGCVIGLVVGVITLPFKILAAIVRAASRPKVPAAVPPRPAAALTLQPSTAPVVHHAEDEPDRDFEFPRLDDGPKIQGHSIYDFAAQVKLLKAQGDLVGAAKVLERIVQACEDHHRSTGLSLIPAYYRELAIVYRKAKRHGEEVDLLERYVTLRGARDMPDDYDARLAKARALRDRA